MVKVGGGGRYAGPELINFLALADGLAVLAPLVSGVIPFSHPRNLGVGGTKGTLCGNYAMEDADLLVAVGLALVCQSDCSRTGYPNVKRVINLNADLEDATHYNNTRAVVGDVTRTLEKLNLALGTKKIDRGEWNKTCAEKKAEWQSFKKERSLHPVLADEYWKGQVLTQPAAIRIATDWAKATERRPASLMRAMCRRMAFRSLRMNARTRPTPRWAHPTWDLQSRHCWRPASHPTRFTRWH